MFSNIVAPTTFPVQWCEIRFTELLQSVSIMFNRWRGYRRVPDFGGRSLDTDPDFGQYCHFCSLFINIRVDKTYIKGLPITISDKEQQLRKLSIIMFAT